MRQGHESEHEAFLDRLESAQGANLLRRCSLTYYALYQSGSDLRIVFRSEKPSIIAGFLRNRRMWPDYWEFERAGESEDVEAWSPRFEWTPA
ncbi:MAG: hypothetical protein HY534_07410 [Chloroflexi bacterium]|nr:hypothetical protein [Chloroflexota bacterium]